MAGPHLTRVWSPAPARARTFATAPIIRTPDGARADARLPLSTPPMTLPPSSAADAAPARPWAAFAASTRALVTAGWARLTSRRRRGDGAVLAQNGGGGRDGPPDLARLWGDLNKKTSGRVGRDNRGA